MRAVTRVHDRRIECGVDAEVDSARLPAAPADQRAVAPGLAIHRANLHEQQRGPFIHEIVPMADNDGRLIDAADCNHVISHSLRSAVRDGGAAAPGEADTVLGNPRGSAKSVSRGEDEVDGPARVSSLMS